MTTTRLTERGKRFLLAFALSLGLGVLFLDTIILTLTAVLGAILLDEIYDLYSVSKRPNLFARLEPNEFHARLIRGESAFFRTVVTARRRLILEFPSMIITSTSEFAPGTNELTLEFSPNLIGEYALHTIDTTIESRYRLFRSRTSLPFEISAKVYPRLVVAVLEALEFLVAGGRGREGEQEMSLIGPGMEYAETRDYLPGDSLRRIDWKATARTSSLMVKHFFREGGGAVHILYMLEAPGPLSHDELATEFVNLVLAAARGNAPISVTIYDEAKRLLQLTASNARQILAASIGFLLRYSKIGYSDVYSIIDVAPAPLRGMTEGEFSERWQALIALANSSVQIRLSDLRALVRSATSSSSLTSFVILSSLVRRASGLLEILQELRGMGLRITVLHPSRPWLDAANLEEAYVMQASFEKITSAIGGWCETVSLGIRPPEEVLAVSAQ